MKAVIFSQHGNPDVLTYMDAPEPQPGANEVVVRVKACALNHLDIWTRLGMAGASISLPHILGCDVAGEVAALGRDVKNLKTGERVVVAPGISCGTCKWCKTGWDSMCNEFNILGFHVNGGYAEYVKVPARNAIPVTDLLSWQDWAACPLVFLTAWHMLVTRAELKKGETVLIHAAGSGVSSAAIQIAKWIGARVITTAGTDEKLDLARNLGADEAINYKTKDFSDEVRVLTSGEGVEVVLEHIGTKTFTKSLHTMAKKGRLVTCGVTSGPNVQIDLRFLFVRQFSLMGCYMGGRSELDQVMKHICDGRFKPIVDTTFPLAEARQAQERMLSRENFGKIVLTVP